MELELVIRVILTTVTLLSGVFVLGGSALLYKQYRTRVLKLIIIFLLSILLISLNFWCDAVFRISFIIPEITSFIGCILCIVIVPYLITSLISRKITANAERIIWSWNLLYILLGVVHYLYPIYLFVLPALSVMLLLTIAFWIIFLFINISSINNKLLKKSLIGFITLTVIFLFLLILDYLITLLPIKSLSVIDNFSLGFYFIGINVGTFFFAGDFLNKEAYMERGKLTDSFLDNFSLTGREGEIIEKAYLGKTNKEIGEELYISTKTVESHLRNIYQKMQIKSRTQLILELNTWKKV